MSGSFAFGGNNSGGQQFRSVMPGVPSMQTSSAMRQPSTNTMDPRMADDDFMHGKQFTNQGQKPLTGNFQPSFMNQGQAPAPTPTPLTGNFQPSFMNPSQTNQINQSTNFMNNTPIPVNQYTSILSGQAPLTGNFQPNFMNQGQSPAPVNRNLNYGPQAVNEPTSTPVPYSPPPHSPLTGNFQPRFPSTITRGYR